MKNLKKIVAGAGITASIAAMIVVGTASSSIVNAATTTQTGTVTVTATVDPVLTVGVGANINLGTLVAGVYSTGTVSVTVGTNAGIDTVVTMSSLGLEGANSHKEIGVNKISTNSLSTQAASTSYRYSTGGTVSDMTVAPMPIKTIVGVVAADVTNVDVAAMIAADTAADTYGDILTFVATGTY